MICRTLELPSVFPLEVRAQATAVACSLVKEKEKSLSRWSLAEIAAHRVTLGVVMSLATRTPCRWFAADKLKPWRYHSWQHILDPQKFLERARPVLRLFEQAKELLLEGIWVICVEEKTSIQARELEQKSQPAKPAYPLHVSPRYQRHGALQLFAGLSVADGKKHVQVAERKRFVDFQAFLTQTIIPEALQRDIHTIKLILDNGPTHAPKQLQDWLQLQTQANHWPLSIEVVWLVFYASWLDQIEIWYSVL